jgi:hypothetical protein
MNTKNNAPVKISKPVSKRLTGYGENFFEWTQQTARAIAEGRFDEIDRAALADEVESFGKRDRREVASRLGAIATHMLKTKYQPERESQSWRNTSKTQRRELVQVLDDSPSLRAQGADLLLAVYPNARADVADEAGLDLDIFPETCEWTFAQVLGSGV